MNFRFKTVAAALVACMLSGCATQRYQWGGYDDALFQAYNTPEAVEALRLKLETHVAWLESAKQKVAPGLYAELGTIYMQRGDLSRASVYYVKEKDAWPESRFLMDAMLRGTERRQRDKKEEK